MSSNRPLFDDEDLPAWLRKGGISGGSRAGAGAGADSSETGDEDIDLSWLDDVSAAPAARAEPLPWDAAPSAAGADEIFGDEVFGGDTFGAQAPAAEPLPWDSGNLAAAAPPPGEFALPESVPPPWEASGQPATVQATPAPPAAQAPLDLSLPWGTGAGDEAEIYAQPAWDSGVDWASMPAEAPAAPETAPAAPPDSMPALAGGEALPWDAEPASDDTSWLQETAAVEDAAPAEPVGPQEDWLADFMGESATPTPAAPLEEPADAWLNEPAPTEDWLHEVESAAPAGPELEIMPGAPAEPDVDAWLEGFLSRPPGETPLETPPALEAAQEPEPAPPPLELPDLEVPDWFASAPATADAAEPAAEPAAADMALDWMADLPPGWQEQAPAPDTMAANLAVDASGAASAPADEDALDWMVAPDDSASATEPAAPLDAEAADLPDWIQGIAPVSPVEGVDSALSAEGEPVAGFGAELAEPLDWMSESESQEVSAAPAGGEAPPAQADIPDWMRGIAPAAPTPMARPVEDAETAAALDWLADVDMAEGAPQAPAEQPAQPVGPFSVEPSEFPISESGELISDVSSADIDALLNLPPSESEPLPPSEEVALVQTVDLDSDALDLDEILGPAEPSAEPGLMGAAAAAEGLPAEIARDAARENLPGWVEQMQPSEVPVVIQVGDQKVRIAEKPVAQLDPQLQKLRDRSREVSAEAKRQGETPSSGPLSGISDAIIPATDQIPAATGAVAGMIIDDLEARRVRVLESLLGAQEEQMRRHVEQDQAEAEAAQPAGKRARRRRRARARNRARFKLDRLIVTAFLALAVVAPFFTDALNVFAPLSFEVLSTEDGARIDTVGAAVDLIQPASPHTLVAFEFRPTGAGEMDDLAIAVLRDVWRRGGIPVVVSTDPSGAVHAQGLIARLANETATLAIADRLGQPLLARQDYVVLGFVPGGAAGVRMLYDALEAGSIEQQVMLGIDIEGQAAGLDDSARAALRSNPVILLAEGQDDVRNWAEQFRPRGESSASGAAPRLILLSSVGASAIAHTYANANPARFGGPLIGLRDATLYNERRSLRASEDDATAAAQRWQSTGLAATAAAVVVLFGAALNGIRSLRRRRTRR